MIGSKARMPKRARYPLFLAGLVVILLGGLLANYRGASTTSLAGIVILGFALLVSAVLVK